MLRAAGEAARLLFAAIALASAACATTTPKPGDYAAVLAAPQRPAADRERDDARHPAETLAFARVGPGQKIGEYMPGGGYFTRLLARAVGAEGVVYAFVPSEIVRLRPAYLDEAKGAAAEPGMSHVRVITGPKVAYSAPEPLDLVFTAQNYHDLYGPFAPPDVGEAFDRAVFAALKPGGFYVVIDHSAAAGTGLRGDAELHRIERRAAIDAITGAGFVLDGESDVLRNPADKLNLSVFDAAVRGGTDQFMLRFRKRS